MVGPQSAETCKEIFLCLVLASDGLTAIFGIPYLININTSLQSSIFAWHSPCVSSLSVCLSLCPSFNIYKNISHVEIGPTLTAYF